MELLTRTQQIGWVLLLNALVVLTIARWVGSV